MSTLNPFTRSKRSSRGKYSLFYYPLFSLGFSNLIIVSMKSPYADIELVSFHSISKGVIGECGRRGGYFELSGFDPNVVDQIYKLASIGLCPPVQGQIMVDLMVNPPRPGDESFDLYQRECKTIYDSLKRRAEKLTDAFNQMEGYSCQPAEGAMYLFPTVDLPPKAVEAAKAQGMKADAFYCLELLNATGVCVVPGSGFGQKPGTWHFRSTFLPPENEFDTFIKLINEFNSAFMKKYKQ
jgi:aspartate/methionine/tyrosine aminotransferase